MYKNTSTHYFTSFINAKYIPCCSNLALFINNTVFTCNPYFLKWFFYMGSWYIIMPGPEGKIFMLYFIFRICFQVNGRDKRYCRDLMAVNYFILFLSGHVVYFPVIYCSFVSCAKLRLHQPCRDRRSNLNWIICIFFSYYHFPYAVILYVCYLVYGKPCITHIVIKGNSALVLTYTVTIQACIFKEQVFSFRPESHNIIRVILNLYFSIMHKIIECPVECLRMSHKHPWPELS